MTLVLSAFAMSAYAALDLRANEQPLPVTRDPQAIAKIPPGYRFVEPGTLTVAISALNSPPLALLASDNRTRIGSDIQVSGQGRDLIGREHPGAITSDQEFASQPPHARQREGQGRGS